LGYSSSEPVNADRTMTPDDVITIFEKLNLEGRATVDLDHACAGFAGWLARARDRLDEEELPC